jgi:hypothetical protein
VCTDGLFVLYLVLLTFEVQTKILAIYTLANGEYALLGEYTGDEPIRSVVLEGIELVTNSLFA